MAGAASGQVAMPLHRHPFVERRVLGLIRGSLIGGCDPTDRGDSVAAAGAAGVVGERRAHLLPFGQLRLLAVEAGLKVQPCPARYVSEDELQLLCWLARAQRLHGVSEVFHPDMRLTRAIFLCAGLMTGLGISLPAMTMLAGNSSPRKGRAALV